MTQQPTEVFSETYRSLSYVVKLVPYDKVDWGEQAGKFVVWGHLPMEKKTYYESVDEAIQHVHQGVDAWLATMPTNFDGWYELVVNCMQWTGYEDCEINKSMLRAVFNKHKLYVETKKGK